MSSKLVFVFISALQIAFLGCFHADSFRLVTYNILSDEYLFDGMYDYVAEDVLSWQNRRVKIVERVKELNPDVLCLQELNTVSFEYFKKELRDFEGVYAKRASSTDDGIGTFCRKSVFDEVDHRIVFCEGTSKCGCLPVQPALFTTLFLKNDKSVLLVNTKIRWSREVKIGSPASNHIQFILKSIPKTEVVLVGDFNMSSEHPLMKSFYSAGLQDGFTCKNTYSCYANKEFQRIDYILLTRDLKMVPFDVPSLEEAQPIPSEKEPSDHLPVGGMIIYG